MHSLRRQSGDPSLGSSGALLLIPILIPILILGGPCIGSAQGWEKVWVTNRGEGLSGKPIHPSIAVDTGRTVHALFAESDGSDATGDPSTFDVTLRYANNRHGNFGPHVLVGSGRGTLYSSLAIDSTSALHAVYTSVGGSGFPCLRHAAYTSDAWQVGDAAACDLRQSFPATAIDGSGTVHIAYENGESINYRRRTADGIWSDPIDVSRNPGRDRTPAIAVAPDGTVHLVFYRWSSTTRRTLMYATASPTGATFSLPESLRVMSGTKEGLELPYTSPAFVPSITLDAAGVCHLVFPSIFGTGSDQGWILYMNNAGGNWSAPVGATGIGFYNRSSIAAASDGSLHIAAERRDPRNNDWDIVYTRNVNGSWEPERDVTNNEFNDFAPANGGRFIEAGEDWLAVVYQTQEPNPLGTGPTAEYEIVVLTQGLVPRPTLELSVEEIDFDTIYVGECRDTFLFVSNAGAGEIATTAPTLETGDGHFELIDAQPLLVGADVSDTIRIRFCPQSKGCFNDRIRLASDAGEKLVSIRGCGRTPAGPYVVLLDTVSGRVGERLLLTAALSPTPTPDDAIESFSIEIVYDPQALYPHRIAEGNGVAIERGEDGTMVISRPPGLYLLDSLLFKLEIEGLVTGKPENRIGIGEVHLGGSTGTVDAEDGLVRLQGCDIGSGVAFGKAVGIGAIAPFPMSDRGTITWHAPTGYSPTLRIIDQQGRVIRSETLPPGNDAEQQASLEIGSLASGWYIVELIDRAERHAVPLLIAE